MSAGVSNVLILEKGEGMLRQMLCEACRPRVLRLSSWWPPVWSIGCQRTLAGQIGRVFGSPALSSQQNNW